MTVDQSMVAFWNWTSISLAHEEEEEQEEQEEGPCQDCGDNETLLIAICVSIGAVLTLCLLYRSYHSILLPYCTAITRPSDGVVRSVPTIYVVQCRSRTGKRESPPPPYDSPPPYHMAVVMGSMPDLVLS
jgi:hypothetical protein